MSLARAVFWNTSIQMAGRLVSSAIGLVVLAIMTRSLEPEGFGNFSTITAFLQFFGIIINFGLTLTANRLLGEVAPEDKEGASRLMSNLMTLRFFSALVLLGLAPLVAGLFFPYPGLVKQGIALAALSFLAIAMTESLVPVFQKNLRLDKAVLAELGSRLILLLGVALCGWLRLGLLWFISAIVAAHLTNYFLLSFFTRVFVRLKLAFDFFLWRRIILTSWPIGISIIFNLVYLKADIIILSLFRSQAEVGFYGAAYRVLDVLTGLATMFMGLVLPLMTLAWVSGNRERFRRLLQTSFDAMAIVALPIVLIVILLGRPIAVFLASRKFAFSGEILAVLILAMGLVFFSTLFGHIVVVLNKQKQMIWGYLIDALLSLAGYLIFIPRFGVWGAAWVTVFSEALIVVLTFLMVAKTSRIIPHLSVFGKGLVSALLAGLAVLFLRDFHWLAALAGGFIVYGAFLYLTGAVKKELINDILKIKT